MYYDLRVTFRISAIRLERGVNKIPKTNQIQNVRGLRLELSANRKAKINAISTYSIISLIEITNSEPANVVVQPVPVKQTKNKI
jgi:hypothetical protein